MNTFDYPARISEPRSKENVLLSIAVPALNEGETLVALYEAVRDVLESLNVTFELVVADNGSTDTSLQILDRLAAEDSRVRPLALSRNFGHQGGLIAAIHHAEGDVVITMDADLQHPPSVIPSLLEKWEEGFDIVNTYKLENATLPYFRRRMNDAYYWLIEKLSGIPMRYRQSDFRLMDRRALDSLMGLPEQNKYLRGLTHWIGYPQTSIAYTPMERYAGESRYMVKDLIKFAVDGLLSFSVLPLRLFTLFGLIIAAFSLLYGFWILIAWMFELSKQAPAGGTSILIGVMTLGGIGLVSVGLLGEYVARIYDETRSRPAFLLRRPPPPSSPSDKRET